MIKCEFYLCVYNQNNDCELKEIEISPGGLCDSCLIPDFPKKTLESCKQKLRDKLKAVPKKSARAIPNEE